MEFDQLIFQKFFRFFNKNRKVDPAVSARTVNVSDIKPKLTILARALTGKAIDIYPASRDGGWQNTIFYLPGTFSMLPTAEKNIMYYIYRLCFLYVQQKLDLNWKPDDNKTPDESIKKALETAPEVLAVMFKEFPSLKPVHDALKETIDAASATTPKNPLPDYTWLYGHWMKNKPKVSGDDLEHINQLKKAISEIRPTTEIEAKAADEVETLQVDKKSQEDFTLSHHFEKVDTAEEFSGVWRDFDGDDSLEKDQEALSELNLKHTVRVDDQVHSVYRADFAGNLNVAESKETDFKGVFVSYPEWNFSARNYKLDYCKVFPTKVRAFVLIVLW